MTEDDVLNLAREGNLKEKIESIADDLDKIRDLLSHHNLTFYGDSCIWPATNSLRNPRIARHWDSDEIPFEDLPEWIEDRQKYKAEKIYGVSKEKYLAYKEFMRNGKCAATTRKGKPCEGSFWGGTPLPTHPADYDPDKKYYCGVHTRCGTNE